MPKEIKNYSVNLLWINKHKNLDQQYIHPAETEEDLVTKFLTPAVKWANANPEGKINIWYDSWLYEDITVENTKAKLAEQGFDNISLQDIRSINFVNENSAIFAADMPLYFRIDFLKMIICLHELTSESMDGVAFSDLEVGDLRPDGGRMSKAELFDEDTMSKLEEFGVVTNHYVDSSYKIVENQFIEMSNDQNSVESLRYSINTCLSTMSYILNGNIECKSSILPVIHMLPCSFVMNDGISIIYRSMQKNALKSYNSDMDAYFISSKNIFESYNKYLQLPEDNFSEEGLFTDLLRLPDDTNFPKEVLITDFSTAENASSRYVDTRPGTCHNDTVNLERVSDLHIAPKFWELDCLIGLVTLLDLEA